MAARTIASKERRRRLAASEGPLRWVLARNLSVRNRNLGRLGCSPKSRSRVGPGAGWKAHPGSGRPPYKPLEKVYSVTREGAEWRWTQLPGHGLDQRTDGAASAN